MEKKFLTATDLMKYEYCPRIIHYIYVLKKPQIVTPKEEKGIKKEADFQHKAKRTKVVKTYPRLPKLFKVRLESDKLGVRTVIDSILINKDKNEAYPIQAKYSFKPVKIYRSQVFQLTIESMLIEECMGYKSTFGFIKFLRSNELVKIDTTRKREEVIESFQNVEKIITSESFPGPTPYKKRCTDCCFKNFCWG